MLGFVIPLVACINRLNKLFFSSACTSSSVWRPRISSILLLSIRRAQVALNKCKNNKTINESSLPAALTISHVFSSRRMTFPSWHTYMLSVYTHQSSSSSPSFSCKKISEKCIFLSKLRKSSHTYVFWKLDEITFGFVCRFCAKGNVSCMDSMHTHTHTQMHMHAQRDVCMCSYLFVRVQGKQQQVSLPTTTAMLRQIINEKTMRKMIIRTT